MIGGFRPVLCVFLCFMVRCFVFEKHRKFYLSSKFFCLLYTEKNASLDSQGEIVAIELPNPEETQIHYPASRVSFDFPR